MPTTPGQGTVFSMAPEGSWGALSSPVFRMPILSESLEYDIARFQSDSLGGGNMLRKSNSWRPGRKLAKGGVQTFLYNNAFTYIWAGMVGDPVTTAPNTPAAGFHTHTYSPKSLLKSFSLHVGIGGHTSVLRKVYTGMMVDSWEVAMVAGEAVTLGMDFVGKDEAITAGASVVGSDPTIEQLHANFGTITIGGASAGCVVSCRIRGANNLDPEQLCVGSVNPLQPARNGFTEISGDIEVRLDGATVPGLYTQFVNGTEAAFVMTAANAAGDNSVTFNGNIRVDGSSPKVNGPGALTNTYPFVVRAPTTDLSGFSVVAINGNATP
jgi:hypothetical protein